MRFRRSLMLGAAWMLVVTAVVLFVRSLETSSERTTHPPSTSPAVVEAKDPGALDAGLASLADANEVSRTSASNAGGVLDVEIESTCGRAGLLDFELFAAGASGGHKLIGRDRVQWRRLTAGDYELRVSGNGWRAHRESVRLADASPRRVVVALEPTRFVRGRVVDRSGEASIRRFSLQIETRLWTPGGQFEDVSDWIRDYDSEDGQFCVGGKREHGTELRVIVSAAGYESGETEWLPAQPTESVSDVILELARTTDALATVAGVVVDVATKRPIEDVDVVFVPPDFDVQMAWLDGGAMYVVESRMSERLERRPRENRTRSLADGTFAIATQRGRSGRLLAYHPGHVLGVSATIEAAGENPPVRVELVRGATLRGVVRTLADGSPFRVERIEIEGPSGHAFANVSEDLRFEAHGLADGVHAVSVLGAESDWRPKTYPRLLVRVLVTVTHQRSVEIEIPLGLGVTGGTIEGRVESPDEPWDAPLLVGTAHTQGAFEAELARAVAPDGGFRLTEVSSGPHWVAGVFRTRDRSRFGIAGARVDVQEGRTHGPLVLDMRASRVLGTARIAGRPADGAHIELVTSAEERHTFAALAGLALTIKTDADGEFVVCGLPPGTYRFRREGGSRIASVEIRDGLVDYTLVIDD